MAVWCAVNSFNAGELSPKMIGRSDVSQYSKGCLQLKNFMVTPYGAVERRPGTKFITAAREQSGDIRLVRFVYSSTIAYILEFGDRYLRFIVGEELLRDADGNILELETPYQAYELDNIKYIQSADVMTIVHPDHPVMELKRTAVNEFTLTEKEFAYPPMLDPNLDDELIITPEGEDLSAGKSVVLNASKDAFDSGNVGGFFQLVHIRRENEIEKDFTDNGYSDSLEVFGYWTFTTHGTWSGTLTIQRSYDNGATWKDYRTYSSAKDSNTSTSGEEEEENVLYRLRMEDYAASSSGTLKLCRCLLVNPDFTVTGVVKIDSVESATKATGTIIKKLGSVEGTNDWNEGAWSDRRGYPCSIAFYEERMMFGGTRHRPQTVWGSKTNEWDNFLLGDKDNDGIEFTLSSDTVNTIAWMAQHNALIIGTMDSEWTLSASNSDAALTPSNFQCKRQSVYGSNGLPAQMVGEVLLFVQRGSRKVREFVYSWEKDGYSSPDMTILADHISFSGIRETALQQLPDSILWCVLNDGTCAALTYERDQDVVGWQKIETAGEISSIAVIPDGDQDRIYLAVRRGEQTCIEIMAPRNSDNFVDCGVEVTAADDISVIEGLDHLEGRTIQILGDGAVLPCEVVKDGMVTLKAPARHVFAGLGYESILSPMPIEIDTQEGSSMLRRKVIGEVRLRYYASVGGFIRAGSGKWQEIISRDVLLDTFDRAVAPKTEVVRITPLGGYEDSTTIEVRQTDPLPMNITALTVNYEVME